MILLNKWFEFKNKKENQIDLYFTGEIASSNNWDDDDIITAKDFEKELSKLPDNISRINLYGNSPGGSVFEGFAICNMLQRHKAKVYCYVDGIMASISSVIACSCDKLIMPENAYLMIHRAWNFAYGNALDLRKTADDLEKLDQSILNIYQNKSNGKSTADELQTLINAESFLSASDCFSLGLCDEVISSSQAVANVDIGLIKSKNIPLALIDDIEKHKKTQEDTSVKINEITNKLKLL